MGECWTSIANILRVTVDMDGLFKDEMAVGILVFGLVAIIVVFIIMLCYYGAQKSKPIQTAHGKILEKQNGSYVHGIAVSVVYVLECDDIGRIRLGTGKRERMSLIEGDKGKITYQGNTLIGFEEE